MDSVLRSTLTKLALPAVAVLVALAVSKWRGISWRDDLGLQKPKVMILLGWIGLWLAWIVVSEVLIRVFGLDQAKAWPSYSAVILVLRVVAIGLVGPFAEELVIRGVIYDRLRRTVFGPLGAIGITAIVWAGMHYAYGSGTLALIFADGVILGLARYRSGSLWVPVAMHAIGNLISIGQSLAL
jgi:membrane protease YdiL (CAAX protease family)